MIRNFMLWQQPDKSVVEHAFVTELTRALPEPFEYVAVITGPDMVGAFNNWLREQRPEGILALSIFGRVRPDDVCEIEATF